MSLAAIDPNQAAQELTGRDYISWSAISTFRQCPLRYYFRYVLGLPEETISGSLLFGSAIHAAVEFYFAELLAGTTPDVDALVGVYDAAWQAREPKSVIGGKHKAEAELLPLARRMLRAFAASSFAKPEGTIIAIEEELRGPVVPGCPDLLARVDLIVDEGDTLTVTDLKTARSRWSVDQARTSAEQLLLYGALARELAPGKQLRLQFAVVTKSKMPLMDIQAVRADHQAIKRTASILQRVWKAIEAGNFYPSPSLLNCPTCPYQRPCRSWTG